MNTNRAGLYRFLGLLTSLTMVLSISAMIGCGDDTDEMGDDGDDTAHEGNGDSGAIANIVIGGSNKDDTAHEGNGDSGAIANIVIGGSNKDLLPTQLTAAIPFAYSVVPVDGDGNDITDGNVEGIVEFLANVKWTVSDDAVLKAEPPVAGLENTSNATVLVTGLKAGSATLTATWGSHTDSINLKVVDLGIPQF